MYFRVQKKAIKQIAEILRELEDSRAESQIMPQSSTFIAPTRNDRELVGRQGILADLKDRLLGAGGVAYSLSGLPGVGKTALALELAYGILWAPLGRNPNEMARLAEWARAVEIPSKDMADFSKPEEYAEAIQKAIGNKRILLIIDDVWSSETARLFRLGGPNCAQLLTTRNSDIADLFAGDRHIVVPELNGEQGFDLLSQIAQSVVQLDETAAEMVVEAIGGLPLGLVLVGNYIKTKMTTVPEQRIKEVLRQLGDAQRQFAVSEPQLGGHPHPSLPKGASISLDAIIKVSDDALKSKPL